MKDERSKKLLIINGIGIGAFLIGYVFSGISEIISFLGYGFFAAILALDLLILICVVCVAIAFFVNVMFKRIFRDKST
ncbi:hypothetical protein KKA23_02930 [Patescibacteria group bacterium]|nr:hypothetical protein [Patescibacteria group bacterium]MBU3923205.1 hypothetical protein [Patescibacteria group bacterium]